MDNYSRHNSTDTLRVVMDAVRTTLHYFPPKCAHLIQPCDSFVTQNIKSAWAHKRERYKMEKIQAAKWKDSAGKLQNPGKSIFLQLAYNAVRDVNCQCDTDGLTYARKAKLMACVLLHTNGIREEGQLSAKLQEVIKKHRKQFDREFVGGVGGQE